MPDITAELYSIKTKSLGDNVLGAIYDALLKIDNYIGPVELDEEVERTATLLNLTDTLGWLADQESYNITEELEVIKNSRYGSEIRMAIHDAIDKLNKAASARPAPPEPSKVGAVMGEVHPLLTGTAGGVFGNPVSSELNETLDLMQQGYSWGQGYYNGTGGMHIVQNNAGVVCSTLIKVPDDAAGVILKAELYSARRLRSEIITLYGDSLNPWIRAIDVTNFGYSYPLASNEAYITLYLTINWSEAVLLSDLSKCTLTFVTEKEE